MGERPCRIVEEHAALAPLENIAKSIEANESAHLAWSETLPTKDDDYFEEPIVEFPDAGLELYDRICGFVRIYGEGPLSNLISEIENSDELSPLLEERWMEAKNIADSAA
jgi:hypothetical protein